MLLREATSQTYGPRVYHINLPTTSYFWRRFYFTFFTLHLYHKNTKKIILSYLSDLTLVSDRVGIGNPLSHWLRGFICLCRYEGLVRGLLLDWYLGSQKPREILTLLFCTTLSSSRENQRKCSRGSNYPPPLGVPCPSLYMLKGRVTCRVQLGRKT